MFACDEISRLHIEAPEEIHNVILLTVTDMTNSGENLEIYG